MFYAQWTIRVISGQTYISVGCTHYHCHPEQKLMNIYIYIYIYVYIYQIVHWITEWMFYVCRTHNAAMQIQEHQWCPLHQNKPIWQWVSKMFLQKLIFNFNFVTVTFNFVLLVVWLMFVNCGLIIEVSILM